MVAWLDSNAWGLESEALGAGAVRVVGLAQRRGAAEGFCGTQFSVQASRARTDRAAAGSDRKSTRLNSSHVAISYAVFCLKKKNKYIHVCFYTTKKNYTHID